MKKFYLNSVEQQVEISSSLAETLDETLDNMTVVLKNNTNKNPIAPYQKFEMKEEYYIYTISGSIEDSSGEDLEINDIIKIYYNNIETSISGKITYVLYDNEHENVTLRIKINKNNIPFAGENFIFIANDEKSLKLISFSITLYDTIQEIIASLLTSADVVELVSQNPLMYKHTLTLIQKSEFLTKKEIRNTVFSTDIFSYKKEESAFSCFVTRTYQESASQTFFPVCFNTNVLSEHNIEIELGDGKNLEKEVSVKFYSVKSYASKKELYEYSTDVKEWNITGNYYEPENLDDVFYENAKAYVTRFPVIEFNVDNTYYKWWTISKNDVKNGGKVKIPDEILNWIEEFSSGNLKISILKSSTYPYPEQTVQSHTTGAKIDDNVPIFFGFSFSFVFYPRSEKNVYEVIDTLLKQQMKETKMYHRDDGTTGSDPTIVPLFKLPDENGGNQDLKELLKKTLSPNFVFTYSNMYEALVEIFKLFDAIFTIDDNGYLDIEYYNEHKKRNISLNELVGKNGSITSEKYSNNLISYFQNTKINDKFPNSNNVDAKMKPRSNSLGVILDNSSNFAFVTPKNIDIITKASLTYDYNATITIKIKKDSSPYTHSDFFYSVSSYSFSKNLDITGNVVESSLWAYLPNDTTNLLPQKLYKYNTFSYQRGSNVLDISGQFYNIYNYAGNIATNVINSALMRKTCIGNYDSSSYIVSGVQTSFFNPTITNFKKISFAVEYIALSDGKLSIEGEDSKYNGSIIVNQGNGSIDINKLGLNMVGLSMKLGQPTLTMTKKIGSWGERIQKGEYFIDNTDNSKWVANVCNFNFITNDVIEETIEFVKNFNGLASRIELNREKRLSNISNELTVKGEELYGEYIYYSHEQMSPNLQEPIALDYNFVDNSLLMNFGETIDSYYIGKVDKSSSVVEVSNLFVFSTTPGSKNEIYKIEGYAQENASVSGEKGKITLLQSFVVPAIGHIDIPTSSASKAKLLFFVNKNSFHIQDGINDFLTNPVTSVITAGDKITALVVKQDYQVYGAVITKVEHDGVEYVSDFDIADVNKWYEKNSDRIEYAIIDALDENNNVVKCVNEESSNIAMPLLVYGSGNSVCFEMSFDHPMNGGNQLLSGYTGFWASGGWFSRPVVYTDDYGTATKFTIDFAIMQENVNDCYPKMVKTWNSNTPLNRWSCGKLEEFAYYKKPNEIFALNYQLHFLPNPNFANGECYLNNELIKNNSFANGISKKIFKIKYSTSSNEQYDVFDIKGFGTDATITNITGNNASGIAVNFNITFSTALTTQQKLAIRSWSVCDEDDNIYFAANAPNGVTDFRIYFISRHHRL